MNTTILSADLDLIQALLNCPEGEEWELLKRHEKLINPEFLQVMSQVAVSLGADGAIADAEKLYYWENQLTRMLAPETPSEPQLAPPQTQLSHAPYLSLIQALLDCPEGQEVALLTANPALVNPQLVQLIQSVSAQLDSQGNQHAAKFLRHWAQHIDRALHQSQQIPHIPTEQLAYKQNGHQVTTPANVQEILNLGRSQTSEPRSTKQDASVPSPWDGEETRTIPPSVPPSLPKPSVEMQLAAIAQGLAQLEKTIADRLPLIDSLWYLEKLERAYASSWILSTEELEQLIGVKPKCHPGQKSFRRGCWEFVKVGKLGTQVGWQVIKPIPVVDEDQ